MGASKLARIKAKVFNKSRSPASSNWSGSNPHTPAAENTPDPFAAPSSNVPSTRHKSRRHSSAAIDFVSLTGHPNDLSHLPPSPDTDRHRWDQNLLVGPAERRGSVAETGATANSTIGSAKPGPASNSCATATITFLSNNKSSQIPSSLLATPVPPPPLPSPPTFLSTAETLAARVPADSPHNTSETTSSVPASHAQVAAPPLSETSIHKYNPLLTSDITTDVSVAETTRCPSPNRMAERKIWVRRINPPGSATRVVIKEDDLVDDVRDTILRKYANTLGRQFDSPDLSISISPRCENTKSPRLIAPEEPMCKVLDLEYPGGQTMDEALLIEVSDVVAAPTTVHYTYMDNHRSLLSDRGNRSTPRLSPSIHRPNEGNEGYFPAPQQQIPSPGAGVATASAAASDRRRIRGERQPHRISRAQASPTHAHATEGTVQLNGNAGSATSQSTSNSRPGTRPSHSRTHSNVSEKPPTTPSQTTTGQPAINRGTKVTTPPARASSPQSKRRAHKLKEDEFPRPLPTVGKLTPSIPPLNVLIVEDNLVNLILLERFAKRLRVSHARATNGQQAVQKWRKGGFHLVLMDIQLPIMTGLDATREIRRLEKANGIGVFTSSASSPPEVNVENIPSEDRLKDLDQYKSPVIIVALTASSLQSDRHEALAAGCNDFLTKVCISPCSKMLWLRTTNMSLFFLIARQFHLA